MISTGAGGGGNIIGGVTPGLPEGGIRTPTWSSIGVDWATRVSYGHWARGRIRAAALADPAPEDKP